MSEEAKKMSGTAFQIRRAANPGKPVFYVNNAQIIANQWDVQLYFSLVQETTPGEFAAVESALIIMTPEHALALSKALQQTLDTYARQQGSIRDVQQISLPLAQK